MILKNCSLPEDGFDEDLPIDSKTNILIGRKQPSGLPCWRDGTFLDSNLVICADCAFYKGNKNGND